MYVYITICMCILQYVCVYSNISVYTTISLCILQSVCVYDNLFVYTTICMCIRQSLCVSTISMHSFNKRFKFRLGREEVNQKVVNPF